MALGHCAPGLPSPLDVTEGPQALPAIGSIQAFFKMFGETALLAAQDSGGRSLKTFMAGEAVLQP